MKQTWLLDFGGQGVVRGHGKWLRMKLPITTHFARVICCCCFIVYDRWTQGGQ